MSLDREHLRVSDAERQAAVDVLRVAFTEGRLDLTEYDTRIGAAYGATTCGGLVTGHAALLVFLAAAAGAEIIPSDFGHLANFISKDGPSVPSRAGRRQVP